MRFVRAGFSTRHRRAVSGETWRLACDSLAKVSRRVENAEPSGLSGPSGSAPDSIS